MRDKSREEKLTTSLVNMEGKPAGDHLEEGGADAVILDVHKDPDAGFDHSQLVLPTRVTVKGDFYFNFF
jgi:hypothetical protein